jgi:hypothetical protein
MPYGTNRISVNSEEDLVNVRLLSISPPAALRPFFQEGYLAGTPDVTWDFRNKTELDFNRRLAGKFEIAGGRDFWTEGFGPVPEHLLWPAGDVVGELLADAGLETPRQVESLGVGEFLAAWLEIERWVLGAVKGTESRVSVPAKAIGVLREQGVIDVAVAERLDSLRAFRNYLVHDARDVSPQQLHSNLADARRLLPRLQSLREL